MSKRRIVLSIVIIAMTGMFLLTGCAGKSEHSESGKNKADNQAENVQSDAKVFGMFTTQTLGGEEVTESIFAEADLTMVNIWGTFCGPCINEMPDLGELGREYADHGVQIVGLISDVAEVKDETALEIVEATQADYMHLVASPDLQRGILREVQVVPTTIFVDSEGRQVGGVYSGANSKEDWKKIIEELRTEVQ